MSNRREFLRRGALWVAGALVVEPVVKRPWAFPVNPAVANPRFAEYLIARRDVDYLRQQIDYQIQLKLAYDLRRSFIYQYGYAPPSA